MNEENANLIIEIIRSATIEELNAIRLLLSHYLNSKRATSERATQALKVFTSSSIEELHYIRIFITEEINRKVMSKYLTQLNLKL